uniref:Uncharacterized protein n=1 Tax=Melanthalia intermedia TaxID=172989 RepID=A0A345UBQ3_9FLOR|nr:hypothetical protein [Melanthalia intermedia]AXI97889.1 hypothetical protein [Melanthalia intermedia]
MYKFMNHPRLKYQNNFINSFDLFEIQLKNSNYSSVVHKNSNYILVRNLSVDSIKLAFNSHFSLESFIGQSVTFDKLAFKKGSFTFLWATIRGQKMFHNYEILLHNTFLTSTYFVNFKSLEIQSLDFWIFVEILNKISLVLHSLNITIKLGQKGE